jgi:NADH dehydrogenase/NADH:ubiquinone oxidoreductase subunit G
MKNIGFNYILGSEENNNIESEFIVYQGFIKTVLYYKADLILASSSPYESDLVYFNLEGRYRFIKQVIKSSINIFNDWDIVMLLNIFNKKKQELKISSIYFFIKIIKYFFDIINYFCNFFFLLVVLL